MKARAVHDFYKSSHPMGGFLMMSHSRYYHRPFHARDLPGPFMSKRSSVTFVGKIIDLL
jgi:hypothetical protein